MSSPAHVSCLSKLARCHERKWAVVASLALSVLRGHRERRARLLWHWKEPQKRESGEQYMVARDYVLLTLFLKFHNLAQLLCHSCPPANITESQKTMVTLYMGWDGM